MPSATKPGPMSEDDYLALVTRLQQAMAIEPFRPSVIDVALLASEWRMHSTEIERLREALGNLLEACDRNVGGLHEGPLSDARREGRAALGRDKDG